MELDQQEPAVCSTSQWSPLSSETRLIPHLRLRVLTLSHPERALRFLKSGEGPAFSLLNLWPTISHFRPSMTSKITLPPPSPTCPPQAGPPYFLSNGGITFHACKKWRIAC